MGLLRRIFGLRTREERAAVPVPESAPPPVDDAESVLDRLAASSAELDLPAAEAAIASLVSSGREARALDLLRRVSAAHGDPPDLAHRAALLLLARGDDASAAPLLERASALPSLASDALFRLAEVHERSGRPERALDCYERVIARDLDFPNARDRAVRLAKSVRPSAAPVAPTLFSPEGTRIQGRFKLLRELGRGGAGAVYLAEDSRLGRTVALKVYHPARSGEVDPDRRLLHEGKVAASIRHPGIIRVLDVLPELRALVLEPLAGSLKDRVRTRIPTDEAIALGRGALEVLDVLHGRGIVHRDLKTSNLLLRADGRIVLSDFGVARVGDVDAEQGIVGTAGYIAPEVIAGAPATPAADVFALGIIFSEILVEVVGDAMDDDRRRALADLAAAMRAANPAERPDALGGLDRLAALDSPRGSA